MTFENQWDTSGIADGLYGIVGYVSYNSTVLRPKRQTTQGILLRMLMLIFGLSDLMIHFLQAVRHIGLNPKYICTLLAWLQVILRVSIELKPRSTKTDSELQQLTGLSHLQSIQLF